MIDHVNDQPLVRKRLMATFAFRVVTVLRRAPILLVEDDDALSSAMTEFLRDEGFEVVSAPNGLAALQQLGRGLQPCVIILDLMMPVMDGWQFRREQLRVDKLKDIPVVILTAAGLSAESIRAHFSDIEIVEKPPSACLLEAIHRACA